MSRAASLLGLLGSQALTLAVAESLTGGLVAAEITAVPGASAVFRGGIVAYATDAKASVLGVDIALLEGVGAVHPDTARAMAEAVRTRFGANWGLATTGVAGPDPQEGKPVGTVHVAVSGEQGTWVETLQAAGDRAAIRAQSVAAVLELAIARIGTPPGQAPDAGGSADSPPSEEDACC